MSTFIGRCRKRRFDPSGLRELIRQHESLSPVESRFLALGEDLYGDYLESLRGSGQEDFDGLMNRAAEAVRAGRTVFERKSGAGDLTALSYIAIDEFQDFSSLFHEVVSAIRSQNGAVRLFCVGDDWQAINGFAGSDLAFFRGFHEHYPSPRRLTISTNYRSASSIVAASNALMRDEPNGSPAIARARSEGNVQVADMADFAPTPFEQDQFAGDLITPMVLRLVRHALDHKLDVALLTRRNGLPWYTAAASDGRTDTREPSGFLHVIRSRFPDVDETRITTSTVHKFKGLEKRAVIILDGVKRSYPLVHPSWVFMRVFGDSPSTITDEERRLFYVALTRAIEHLTIITDKRVS
jgi:DNA helicase IV